MNLISSLAMPGVMAVILIVGVMKGVKVYDSFVSGAKQALGTAVGILPPLVGLMVAIGMFNASGAMELIARGLAPFAAFLGIPHEILPLGLMRPISGSGALALIDNLFKQHGPDSFIGRAASIIMGSTETTFYTLTVYVGAVHAKNTRHALKSALLADLTGLVMGVLVCRIFFGI